MPNGNAQNPPSGEGEGGDQNAPAPSDTEREKEELLSDPLMLKYSKMLKFGIPKRNIQMKMEEEGVDPQKLDVNFVFFLHFLIF